MLFSAKLRFVHLIRTYHTDKIVLLLRVSLGIWFMMFD